jgi:hypothetical protein
MERLEEISDENLVSFYREELEKIDRSVGMAPLIPGQVRSRLIRLGVLEYRKGLDRTSGLVLSPKGREMLDGCKEGAAGVRGF